MINQNNGGCDALTQKITYVDRKRSEKGLHGAGMPWWTNSKANLVLVPIFSTMDGMVLYSIFDECLMQSVLMGIVMAFGVAVVLNILPLIIARFVHAAMDRTVKHAVLIMTIFIAGFLLIYGGTVYLRFSYSDMYGHESQSMTLENTVSNNNKDADNDLNSNMDDSKGNAVALLLSISPFITSLLGFGIAFASDDETRKKVEYLELEKIEIDEKILDTQAAIEQMEYAMKEGVEWDLEADEQTMNAAIEEIIARCNILKALARLYLAEYLANPSATTKVSQEMLIANEKSSDGGHSEAKTKSNSENPVEVILSTPVLV
ncbi:MAG: hypothetical protein K2G45_12655 [Lachnospiraceae bacterium]|nr:hypothetical protein [Lachnospiraceae bacterium]